MDKETIQALLSAMLKMSDGVSDLLFVAGKPPLIEIHGRLHEFPIDTEDSVLSSGQIQKIADHIIDGNERLFEKFEEVGSCDCSYVIPEARFRVNIFRQSGRYAIAM